MVNRLDPCGIICVLFAYAAVFYADYVVINWLVIPVFTESLWGVFHVAVFNTLLFLLLIAHGRAMMSDPGVVPLPRMQLDFSDLRYSDGHGGNKPHPLAAVSDSDSEYRPRNNYVGEDWTVCGRCEAYRPPRAHHCRICKRCIRKMDHHCPWVNNCVGEYNQKFFLQFLIYVGLASVYCISLVVSTWFMACPGCKGERMKHARVLHSVCVTVECALFCLFVLAVCCDQLQAILSDETAVEQIQKRGPYRPFKSRFALLKEVFGSDSILCWFFPIQNSPNQKEYVHLPMYHQRLDL